MYWDKKDKKYLKKIYANVGARKTKFFRRNLHINGLNTIVKVIRLRSISDVDTEINGFEELPSNICYMLTHKAIKVIPPFGNDVEVVVTNNKSIATLLIKNSSNLDLPKNYGPVNVWYFKKGTIDFLSIKNGDIINTR